jgi:hypothetical protein
VAAGVVTYFGCLYLCGFRLRHFARKACTEARVRRRFFAFHAALALLPVTSARVWL